MIIGIGTDIVAVKRIEAALESKSFIDKVYTSQEQMEAESRSTPLHFYATRFAGKEAVFKSLGISPDDVRLLEIEILTDELGAPWVRLHGRVRQLAEEHGIGAVQISLSWEREYAVAFAVAQ